MAAFEKVFEDLDVTVMDMNGAIDTVTASTTDSQAVDALLREMQSDQAL